MRRSSLILTFAATLLATSPALAQGRQGMPDEMPYGAQMMTEQERLEYHEQMRRAKTEAERERIRAEHHVLMQERARERGITLPDKPQGGMGQGQGMGPGMGGGRGGGKGG